MSKAKILSHEERLLMTRNRSTLLQDIREEKDLPPPFPGAEETNAQNKTTVYTARIAELS